MHWVGQTSLSPENQKSKQTIIKQTKNSKPMKEFFLLFIIVILVSCSCVGLKGQWWQSYRKGFYRKSAENKRESVQRLRTCVQYLDMCQIQGVGVHEKLAYVTAYCM
ncbi:DLA class II histocompatibility antigen, DR-1 beta chain-like [Platysternon megacephalum]|uniref:DLA class II histocompatibility antigen, DR-1 beta chain-like n=1 Tax=Platysternon megacephalum TaxID=55544 RepID=A0A4D9DXQ3_9SAUR|nr:DLA class II histocompatibility antigen, DR-1 beta chain-like [Platysternon megacephalum]